MHVDSIHQDCTKNIDIKYMDADMGSIHVHMHIPHLRIRGGESKWNSSVIPRTRYIPGRQSSLFLIRY